MEGVVLQAGLFSRRRWLLLSRNLPGQSVDPEVSGARSSISQLCMLVMTTVISKELFPGGFEHKQLCLNSGHSSTAPVIFVELA